MDCVALDLSMSNWMALHSNSRRVERRATMSYFPTTPHSISRPGLVLGMPGCANGRCTNSVRIHPVAVPLPLCVRPPIAARTHPHHVWRYRYSSFLTDVGPSSRGTLSPRHAQRSCSGGHPVARHMGHLAWQAHMQGGNYVSNVWWLCNRFAVVRNRQIDTAHTNSHLLPSVACVLPTPVVVFTKNVHSTEML